MGIADVGTLSLGQWAACVRAWNRANGVDEAKAPSAREFELAVAQAIGSA